MKNLIDSYKKTKNLHHAYAIEGNKKAIIQELYDFFENDLKIKTKANPDFYFNDFENFGIDNGRELRDLASRKAVSGGKMIFIIAISAITHEAQNALLKLFEEPAEGAHFFIITQTSEIFLPTLRSRLQILSQGLSFERENTLAANFAEASMSERLNLLKDIIENKDKEKSLEFLNNLEATLYKNKSKSHHWKNQDIEVFEMLQKSRGYIRGRAPSVKMILENIAFSV